MKLDPQDPRLTGYALGELDETESAAVEAALADSPECRRVVDEIRGTTGLLTTALESEPCPELSEQHREQIEAALAPTRKTPQVRWRFPRLFAWPPRLATAGIWATACVIALGGCYLFIRAFTPSPGHSGQPLMTVRFDTRSAPPVNLPPPPPSPQASVNVANLLWPLPGTSVVAPLPAPGPLILSNGTLLAGIPSGTDGSNSNTRIGAGTLDLNGYNTYSGNTILAAGRIAGQYDVSTLTFNGGTLAVRGDQLKSISGRMAPANINGYTGGTINFNGGTLVVKNGLGAPIHDVNWSSFNGGFDINNNGNAFVMNRLGDAGQTTKLGAGTLVLHGNNTYTGGTVNDGFYTGGTVNDGGTLYVGTGSGEFSYYGGIAGAWANVRSAQPCQPFVWNGRYNSNFNTEAYDRVVDNPFLAVQDNPLSTFSIDVDTASYANVRRFLNDGRLPPKDAVRIEEMVNYFSYNYPPPQDGRPFSVNVEVAGCPWNVEHRLVRIGLKGKTVAPARRPPCNLVFLIDVSGSMGDANKLSLIKPAMRMLVERLTENERVAIVVYADSARVVLPSTPGDRKQEILDAIDALQSGGCTNGGDGIRWAYRIAQENFIGKGVNRVILCTDGDFNVGVTNQGDLVRMIEAKAKSGVFLTVLGFGMGNLKDSTMEKLADKGNGNYAYIDTLNEAHKVLVAQMNGTLVTIAKDVKIQVEFNPAQASAYRLIGYENRLLRKEDFANDKKDAGEIGAGHTVTAVYEVVPADKERPLASMSPLKYQSKSERAVKRPAQNMSETVSKELLTVKLRYKAPDADTSQLIERAVTDTGASYARASGDFKFAVAVAGFGMLLRDSEDKGIASYDGVIELAEEGRGADESGYRAEFVSLAKRAKAIARK